MKMQESRSKGRMEDSWVYVLSLLKKWVYVSCSD